MIETLHLKRVYSSSNDNLVKDFYNPLLEHAQQYDRITGFYSPKVLALAARGFSHLVANGGKIRIITSIELDSETYNALNDSSDLLKAVATRVERVASDKDELKSQLEKDYYSLFMALLRTNVIELKIAATNHDMGILHEKIGIITDSEDMRLSFSGSNNETIYGWTKNVEEFKVFPAWDPATIDFYRHDRKKFDTYWSGQSSAIKIISVDEAFKRNVLRVNELPEEIEELTKRIQEEEAQKSPQIDESADDNAQEHGGRNLRKYQEEAIDHWVQNDYKSIFEMATGTGKTFTAINALKEFRENNDYLRAIVVVPLTTLTIQWRDDIKKVIPDVMILNTSANPKWKDELNNLVLSRQLGRDINYFIITTYSMFANPEFSERVAKLGDDNILLADEMHNLVNKNRIAALSNSCYKYKLGLSATPTRLWQQDESAIARLHFGNNSYQYSLEDAITNKFLVPYNYHPLPIYLTSEEYEEFVRISREIARLSQMTDRSEENSPLNMKLIARARIKKNAENKLLALESTLNKLRSSDSLYDALIYVDNEDFLQQLQEMLTSNNIRTTKFTGSNTLEERLSTIKNLHSHSINAIVAIKCLDEGVDIPSAKVAFFISNNTDPREYVQRLGRVLRLDDEGGKDHADVYDYLVMPPQGAVYEDEVDRRIARNMVKNELIRSRFFYELAMNSKEAKEVIEDAVDKYGFYFDEDELVYNIGNEND
jgi:superfamily II DNA or RNA helicase